MREERREAEEHAEALRREMLAQELAEAEAQGAPGEMDGDGDEQMMMGEGEQEGVGVRDLDDDIPDADEGAFGFDGASDDDEDEENDEAGETEGRRQHPELANIQATEERMREMMVRRAGAGDMYGGEEDLDDEERGQMLEEDDLVSSMYPDEMEPDMDMGMEANLDDDVPDAESLGGYEHTDSEASLSSDEEVTHNTSFAGMRAPSLPRPGHPRGSMDGPGPRSSMGGHGARNSMAGGPGVRSSFGPRSSFGAQRGPRDSLDLSSILSRDGSSVAGSSPRLQRRN